jgi:PTH1 family peptidyl-tRNA hydrolase
MKIIVGLGNPDKKYDRTRHNAGWLVLDKLAEQLQLNWSLKKDWQALVAEGPGFILLKPQTYMNLSGQAVAKAVNYYKLGNGQTLGEQLLVVHDDLDLPFATSRYSLNSSAAGHNGIKSIINSLGGQNFQRCRLGIKTDQLNKVHFGFFKTDAAKFVLGRFNNQEWQAINALAAKLAADIAATL